MPGQKLTAFLTFAGRAEEAIALYTSLFPDSEVLSVERWGPGEPGAEGTVKLARLSLAGQELMCSESSVEHAWTFTPAVSLYVRA